MRILVITPGFLPTIGGAEIGVHEIYFRLSSRHKVFILTQSIKEKAVVLPGYDLSRYTILRYQDWMNLGRLPGRMLLRGLVPPFSLGATFATSRAIPTIKPDVVNVHYAIYTGLAAIWTQKFPKIPTVLSLVGRDAAPGPQVPALWPWYASQISRRVQHTIFISQFCRKPHPSDLSHTIIPYGVDTQIFKPSPPDIPLKKALNISTKTRILFSLQRLAPIKRVISQIRIARNLFDSGIQDFILLIGGSGPEREWLEDQVRHLGLSNHVRFLGYIPELELPAYFSLADLFLMTSAFETFGIVLAQALSSGVPVIAYQNSAIPEVIEHGKCGLLATDGDVDAMLRYIQQLLSDQPLHRQMSQNARSRAIARYDWSQIASQYEQTLEAACQ